MAAEAGARLSGIEFCNYHGIVPKGGSVDKNGYLLQASFFDADGHEVHRGWSSQYGVMGIAAAEHFSRGPVYCQFTQVPAERRPSLRAGQPNLFTQFDRLGIDPFTQKFEVEPMFEGSVRGSGGILVEDDTCATAVPGLWVAGDSASREMLVGASSGAGSVNAAWTLSSGRWAGRAAFASETGRSGKSDSPAPIGFAGTGRPVRNAALLAALQAEILPLDRSGFRNTRGLARTNALIGGLRAELDASGPSQGAREALARRELQSMLAVAAWGTVAALLRDETRGVHRRSDSHRNDDPNWRRRMVW